MSQGITCFSCCFCNVHKAAADMVKHAYGNCHAAEDRPGAKVAYYYALKAIRHCGLYREATPNVIDERVKYVAEKVNARNAEIRALAARHRQPAEAAARGMDMFEEYRP